MKMTEYVNLYTCESNNKSGLLNVCNEYNIPSDRIYWNNFTFFLDVFKMKNKKQAPQHRARLAASGKIDSIGQD